MEIPRGRGSKKPTFLKESTLKLHVNWKFQGGGVEIQTKIPSVEREGRGYFLSGTTQCICVLSLFTTNQIQSRVSP